MSAASQTIDFLFTQSAVDIDRLGAELNAMNEVERVATVRTINGNMQARLWEAARDRKTTIDDLVPADLPPGTEVIHAGKNSLPVFSSFEKRFCRPSLSAQVLYGYNEGFTRRLIGPGYFVAEYVATRREVGINYYKVPPPGASLPVAWPKVQPNEKGLQILVFAKMVDFMRKISNHVTVGRAYKHGRETPNYFLLCRREVR